MISIPCHYGHHHSHTIHLQQRKLQRQQVQLLSLGPHLHHQHRHPSTTAPFSALQNSSSCHIQVPSTSKSLYPNRRNLWNRQFSSCTSSCSSTSSTTRAVYDFTEFNTASKQWRKFFRTI
uniref:Uncharacterized protein n=1 Tax=Meloidogyne enterolobii TaxID=390850 RepID=A0A6V7W7B9_MELEN|nr:unnamed protein product [Meloidogyne enterolobii]